MSNSSKEVILRCKGLGKKFSRDLKSSLKYAVSDIARDMISPRRAKSATSEKLRKDEFWALQNVNFELRQGECLGLLGRNGVGKSTLLRILSGILKQDYGSFEVKGSIGGIIALGAGFNPVLTGRENLKVYAAIKGISQKVLEQKEREIIEFSEIGGFIDSPFRNYSSGMQVRLAFAAAAILQVPDVLLIDEVLAVGDIKFIGKCFNLIEEIKLRSSIVLVSHSMGNIRRFCNRACLLSEGKILKEDESVEKVISAYVESLNTEGLKNKSIFLEADGEKIHSGLCINSEMPRTSIIFPKFDRAKFAEVIIKRIGGENVVAFSTEIINRLPVVKLVNTERQKLSVDLRELPSGNYFFSISQLDASCKYVKRLPEVCHFSIINDFESFSPIVKQSNQNG